MAQDFLKQVLYTNEQIVNRCEELGSELSKIYEDKNPLIIGLLKGSVPFLAELIKHITVDMEIDFMDVSSYGDGTTSSGNVKIVKDLDISVTGRDIIIAEDIIDTGRTLKVVKELLLNRGAASVKVVCLLDKKERREALIEADIVGFTIPNEFVIGFGLDYAQKYRNLPYIGVLKEECYK